MSRVIFFLWFTQVFYSCLVFAAEITLSPPEFSHESGFYAEDFDLVLSHADPEVQIFYTLDGSDPDPSNLNGSTFCYKNKYAQPPATKPTGQVLYQQYKTHLYTKPLRIVDRTFAPDRLSQISTTFDEHSDYFPKPAPKETWINDVIRSVNAMIHHLNRALNRLVFHYTKYMLRVREPNGNKKYIPSLPLIYKKPLEYLFKGTPVRALAFSATQNASEINSKVFFIGEQQKFDLPIINITVPEKDLFDYEEGILVAGKKYDEWIASGTSDHKLWMGDWPVNWNERTDKNAFISVFDQHRKYEKYEQTVAIRTHGAGSRRVAIKSIRLQPKKKFDKNGLEFDLFCDERNIGLAKINLRNAGQEYQGTYFTDAANHRIMQGLSFGTQRYKPYLVFINAEFYGILNARDRSDHHYIQHLFNLPNKDIDFLKADTGRKLVVKKGDEENWKLFIAELQKDSPLLSYEELASQISIQSFIDYQAAEIFIANSDWPRNNLGFWRYKGSGESPLTQVGYTDGRWRWLFFDTDATGDWLGRRRDKDNAPKHNTLEHATNPAEEGTLLLRSGLEIPRFKEEFITRFSDLLNSWFLPERTAAIIRDAEKGIEKEMPRHIARWGVPRQMEDWRKSVNELVMFFEQRPSHQRQHLQDFFHLDGFYNLKVDIHEPGTGKIKVNTLLIGDDTNKNYDVTAIPLFFPWSGQYFKDLPLTLEAVPAQGYEFSHWQGLGISDEQSLQSLLTLTPSIDLHLEAVMVKDRHKLD